jgi:bifunctional DNase/RNase
LGGCELQRLCHCRLVIAESEFLKGYEMPIEMQLAKIIISEINENQIVFLREVDGDREFPILIGIFEATSIDRRVKNIARPRPLTHDLIVEVVDSLGGELDSVVITELREATYYANLRIKRDGEIIEIDTRPSDAIAIAVTCTPRLPIYVAESVLDEAISSGD